MSNSIIYDIKLIKWKKHKPSKCNGSISHTFEKFTIQECLMSHEHPVIQYRFPDDEWWITVSSVRKAKKIANVLHKKMVHLEVKRILNLIVVHPKIVYRTKREGNI